MTDASINEANFLKMVFDQSQWVPVVTKPSAHWYFHQKSASDKYKCPYNTSDEATLFELVTFDNEVVFLGRFLSDDHQLIQLQDVHLTKGVQPKYFSQ